MIDIYYAVGHGRRPDGRQDPGATSEDGGWTEQAAGDHVVRAAAARSRAVGLDVRDEAGADDPNFIGSTQRANAANARRIIEVHHDWHKAPPGAFCFWYPGSTQGEDLADAILAEIEAAGFPTRPEWHKATDEHYILRETRMPAVLVECGRIGQDSLDTRGELETMGRAIARGLHRHLGLVEPYDDTRPRGDMIPVPATIRHGDQDGPVGLAQGALMAAGIGPAGLVNDDGLPDRDFGPRTDDHVRTYQDRHGLAVDGIVGPVTWGALLTP